MAGRKISAVKIKQLAYAAPLATKPTKATLTAAIEAATKITNVHGGTFQYEETAGNITQFKNQLTGKNYRADVEPGEKSIAFTIGEYDFETKAALQGGTAAADSWESGDASIIKKAIYATTEDNVCIVFPCAMIVARGSSADNAIGIALSAAALESNGLKEEYWFDIQPAG